MFNPLIDKTIKTCVSFLYSTDHRPECVGMEDGDTEFILPDKPLTAANKPVEASS